MTSTRNVPFPKAHKDPTWQQMVDEAVAVAEHENRNATRDQQKRERRNQQFDDLTQTPQFIEYLQSRQLELKAWDLRGLPQDLEAEQAALGAMIMVDRTPKGDNVTA